MILAVVGSALAVAAILLADSIGCSIDRTSTTIASGEPPNGPNYGNSNPKGNANGHRPVC